MHLATSRSPVSHRARAIRYQHDEIRRLDRRPHGSLNLRIEQRRRFIEPRQVAKQNFDHLSGRHRQCQRFGKHVARGAG